MGARMEGCPSLGASALANVRARGQRLLPRTAAIQAPPYPTAPPQARPPSEAGSLRAVQKLSPISRLGLQIDPSAPASSAAMPPCPRSTVEAEPSASLAPPPSSTPALQANGQEVQFAQVIAAASSPVSSPCGTAFSPCATAFSPCGTASSPHRAACRPFGAASSPYKAAFPSSSPPPRISPLKDAPSSSADGRAPLQAVGPFGAHRIDHASIKLTTFDTRNPAGGEYEVKLPPELFKMVDADVDDWEGRGRLSSISHVTLAPDARRAANVPLEAQFVAFAYPLSDEETIANSMAEADGRLSFLKHGGFVYFASGDFPETLQICAANALGRGSGVHFSGPYFLDDEANANDIRFFLYDFDRVEQINSGPLHSVGVEGFCWVAPQDGHLADGPFTQRNLHGAFVYFFNESLHARDCYFVAEEPPARPATPPTGAWAAVTVVGAPRAMQTSERSPRLAFGCCWPLGAASHRVVKAEASCMLHRPLDNVWLVKVVGHIDKAKLQAGEAERPRWYRRRQESYTDESGAVWVKQREAAGRSRTNVWLTLMPALPMSGRRLKTFSRSKVIVRSAAGWTALTAEDLGGKSDEILEVHDSFAQHRYAWYLIPLDEVLKSDEPLQAPRACRGTLYRLVLPYSGHAKVLLLGEGFAHLGIGVQLYFAQLVSLAAAFLLMGFASFGSLLTNLAYASYGSQAGAAAPTGLYFLVGTALGARTEPFDLFQSANSELAASICFTAYLVWLHIFNTTRARQSQEREVTAADYTVELWGLSTGGRRKRPRREVVELVEAAITEYWEAKRLEAYRQQLRNQMIARKRFLDLFLFDVQGWVARWARVWGFSVGQSYSHLAEDHEESRASGKGGGADWVQMSTYDGFKREALDAREQASQAVKSKIVHHVEPIWKHLSDQRLLERKRKARVAQRKEEEARKEANRRKLLWMKRSGSEAKGRMRALGSMVHAATGFQDELSKRGWLNRLSSRARVSGSHETHTLYERAHSVLSLVRHRASHASVSEDDELLSRVFSSWVHFVSHVQYEAGMVADRCFVTFRYAADANAACKIFCPWYERGPMKAVSTLYNMIMSRDAGLHLRATRAYEVDDLIWDNLWAKGLPLYQYTIPLVTWGIILGSVIPTSQLVLTLTSYKLELASSGIVDERPLLSWAMHPIYRVLRSLGFNMSSKEADVITAAALTSSVVILINLGLREILGYVAQRLELPFAQSKLQARLMTISATVYICNYVLVLYVAHSPLRERDYSSVLVDFAVNTSNVLTHANDCMDLEFSGEHVSKCLGIFGAAIEGMWLGALEGIVTSLANQNWYDVSGLIPQIIVLAITDIIVLAFMGVGITLVYTAARRAYGRYFTYSQARINEAYTPQEFTLGERYAALIKHAAIVLVFAPAAPILYFIGGGGMLLTAVVQKWALVKLYKRPPSLDETMAQRSHRFLHLLLFFHVTSSYLFYVRQAVVTGSTWNRSKTSPFEASFIIFCVYTLTPLHWICSRNVGREESGADDMRYQEALDKPDLHLAEYQEIKVGALNRNSYA